jgi:predicted ArsR family transcriptional regulator
MAESDAFRMLSQTRQQILRFIKSHGGTTAAFVSQSLGISDEAARQHLLHLESQGWARRSVERPPTPQSGRPVLRYELTEAGDGLFPKRYAELADMLMQGIRDLFGEDGLERVLANVADQQVSLWEPRLRGKTTTERLETLKGIYFEDDAFAEVEDDDEPVLVQLNCPFPKVADKHPGVCGMTIDALSRLLGVRIDRRRRFQDGDGRCSFHLIEDAQSGGKPVTNES